MIDMYCVVDKDPIIDETLKKIIRDNQGEWSTYRFSDRAPVTIVEKRIDKYSLTENDNIEPCSLFDIKDNVKPCFVGVLAIEDGDGKVSQIISFPKHYKNIVERIKADTKEVWNYAGRILKLIKRYKRSLFYVDPLFRMCTDRKSASGFKQEIAAAIALYELYLECGIYTVRHRIYNYRKGTTLWGQTTSRILPHIIDDNVIYPRQFKMTSEERMEDISELQKSMLAYYSQRFPLIIPQIDNTWNDKLYCRVLDNDFEKKKYITKIKKEIGRCFRKDWVDTLETMRSLLEHTGKKASKIDVYAVSDYSHVAEKVIAGCFGNQLYDDWGGGERKQCFKSVIKDDIEIDINDVYPSFVSSYIDRDSIWCKRYSIRYMDTVYEIENEDEIGAVIIDSKYYKMNLEYNNWLKTIIEEMGKYANLVKQFEYEDIMWENYRKINNDLSGINIYNTYMIPWVEEADETENTPFAKLALDDNTRNTIKTQPVKMINIGYFERNPHAGRVNIVFVYLSELENQVLSGLNESDIQNNQKALFEILSS